VKHCLKGAEENLHRLVMGYLAKRDVFYVCGLNSDCMYPLGLIMAVGHRLSDYSRKVIVAGEDG
jgi:hypothetical protein